MADLKQHELCQYSPFTQHAYINMLHFKIHKFTRDVGCKYKSKSSMSTGLYTESVADILWENFIGNHIFLSDH